jgi:protein-disulfide isomerase
MGVLILYIKHITLSLCVFVVGVVLLFSVTDKREQDALTNASLSVEDIVPPPSPEDHYKWRSSTSVTVINYFSVDCPHCRELFLKEEEMRTLYDDTFSLVYRHSPLPLIQPFSFEKSVIAECVYVETNEGQFFVFLKEIFMNYESNQMSNEWVKRIGDKYVSNQDKFNDCIITSGRETVARDLEVSLAHSVYGTPTIVVFVEGEQLVRLNLPNAKSVLRLYDSLRSLTMSIGTP